MKMQSLANETEEVPPATHAALVAGSKPRLKESRGLIFKYCFQVLLAILITKVNSCDGK